MPAPSYTPETTARLVHNFEFQDDSEQCVIMHIKNLKYVSRNFK